MISGNPDGDLVCLCNLGPLLLYKVVTQGFLMSFVTHKIKHTYFFCWKTVGFSSLVCVKYGSVVIFAFSALEILTFRNEDIFKQPGP